MTKPTGRVKRPKNDRLGEKTLHLQLPLSSGTAEQGRLEPTHFLATNGFIFVGKVLKIISTLSAE